MIMSQTDKARIQSRGLFLTRRGYRVNTDQYDVTYKNGEMEICVFYERYDNHQDILLKFPDRKAYYLHWMVLVLEEPNTTNLAPIDLLLLYMDYLERNYDNLMKQEYCEQNMEKVWAKLRTRN